MTVSEVDTIENGMEVNNDLPPPHVQDMINHAINQEYTKANNIFDDMMTIKLNDLLDQEEVRLADQIFNGAEEDEDTDELGDEEGSEDQLELDLETEDESESEESDDEEESEEI
jgi:hypothetical protein